MNDFEEILNDNNRVQEYHDTLPDSGFDVQESLKIKTAGVYEKSESHIPSLFANALKPKTGSADILRVSSMITTAIRWVVAMDYYHETGDIEYDTIAKNERLTLYSFLTTAQSVKLSSLEQEIVVAYWNYEANLKKLIWEGYVFSDKEIHESIMRRSSDSRLYGTLTNFEYNYPAEITEVMHIIQAIEDVWDCIDDYEEDLEAMEPNIFLLYLLGSHIQRDMWPEHFADAHAILTEHGCISRLKLFVDDLYRKATETTALKEFHPLREELDKNYESVMQLLVSGVLSLP